MSYGGRGVVFVQDLNFDPPRTPTAAPIPGVVQDFCLGPANRVEWLRAIITPNLLGQGTATNQAVRNFARNLGNANDDAGHIVADRLGGLGTVNWNIFPQSPNINRGAWKVEIEGLVHDAVLGQGLAVEVRYRLEYPPASNRPQTIWVQTWLPQNNNWVPYTNEMVNP
jgi:DNA/RNA non-specific endonuclease